MARLLLCSPQAAHPITLRHAFSGVEHGLRHRNGVGVICVAPSEPNGSTTCLLPTPVFPPGRDKPLASRRLGTGPLLKLTELGLPFSFSFPT